MDAGLVCRACGRSGEERLVLKSGGQGRRSGRGEPSIWVAITAAALGLSAGYWASEWSDRDLWGDLTKIANGRSSGSCSQDGGLGPVIGVDGHGGKEPVDAAAMRADGQSPPDPEMGNEGSGVDKTLPSVGSSPCGSGMLPVQGLYCPLLHHVCDDPVPDSDGRCERYRTDARCLGGTIPMHFCMDIYEYPNQPGVRPVVMVDYAQAQAACEREGKRLCSGREWTLACEGPGWWPYPYGYQRAADRCNIDQPHRFPDPYALLSMRGTSDEITRLDQRLPSGAMAGCVSRYGIFDMTGNVDEWIRPDGPEGGAGENHPCGLKGGYFGPVKTRCRPTTIAHGPSFRFYQVGFRCCRDAPH
jgi:formylglycine-generating enzyme